MTDLLDAVDALTKVTRTKVIVGDGVVTVTLNPLLRRLDEAVTSAIGNGGGGGTATGSVLNDDALYRASLINTQILSWCRMVGVRPVRDMVADLRAWYVAHIGRLDADEFYVRQLRSWAGKINELLDPPKRVPLEGACVICEASTYPNDEGMPVPYPLLVTFRQYDPFGTARAVCRACEAVWDSAQAVSELVEELDEKAG